MQIDPELLQGFIVEGTKTVSECKFALTMFAASGEWINLRDYGFKMSRMSEASGSLGLVAFGDFLKLSGELGLRSEGLDKDKIFSIHSLLAQALKEVEKQLGNMSKGGVDLSPEGLALRLKLEKLQLLQI